MTFIHQKTISRRTLLSGIAATTILSACSIKDKKHDAEIIVIGAGLSGLYAATLLTEAGKDVLVLEGSDRIGGRLYTIESAHGLTEGGGEQVGGGYARIRYMAEKLGVPLLAEIPLHMDIRLAADGGAPIVVSKPESSQAAAFRDVAKQLIAKGYA